MQSAKKLVNSSTWPNSVLSLKISCETYARTVSIEQSVCGDARCKKLLMAATMFVWLFSVGSSDLQKIKKTIDNLYTEKQKIEKEKSKKGSKGKTKVNLRIETDNVSWSHLHIQFVHDECNWMHIFLFQANIKEYGTYESYDYDDFM